MAGIKHIGFAGAAAKAGAGKEPGAGARIIGAALAKARHNPTAVKRNPHLLNGPHGKVKAVSFRKGGSY